MTARPDLPHPNRTLPAGVVTLADHEQNARGLLDDATWAYLFGAAADVCVFDPDAWWRVERRTLASQGKNTPFAGLEVAGRVRWTLVGGEIAHQA